MVEYAILCGEPLGRGERDRRSCAPLDGSRAAQQSESDSCDESRLAEHS